MEINIRSLTLRNPLSAFIVYNYYENVTAPMQGTRAAPHTEQWEQVHVVGAHIWNVQSAGGVAPRASFTKTDLFRVSDTPGKPTL